MQSAERHVLEKAAKELVSRQRHRPASAVAATSVGEGDGASVASGDGLVGESGAVNVAGEVVEHDAGASNGFGEDDPALVPGDLWQAETGHGAASESEETAAKVLGESADGHEEGLLALGRLKPGPPIRGESASGHEQMDVGMPLEGTGPGVKHGEGADAPAEPVWVGTQGRERVEGGA
jgi:hypothetical protein